MPKCTTVRHMFISRCLVRYEHLWVIKTTKNELIFRSINRYLSFPALTVRFITRRFIGDYDPDLGRSNSDAVTLGFMIKCQGHLTYKEKLLSRYAIYIQISFLPSCTILSKTQFEPCMSSNILMIFI